MRKILKKREIEKQFFNAQRTAFYEKTSAVFLVMVPVRAVYVAVV